MRTPVAESIFFGSETYSCSKIRGCESSEAPLRHAWQRNRGYCYSCTFLKGKRRDVATVVRFGHKRYQQTPNTSFYSTLFGGCFGDGSTLLARSFLCVFSGSVFFVSWATFGRPKRQKGCPNGAQSDEKGGPKAPCGTCQKHGRHCTGGTWGGSGEGPGISFFRNALRSLPHTLPRRV